MGFGELPAFRDLDGPRLPAPHEDWAPGDVHPLADDDIS